MKKLYSWIVALGLLAGVFLASPRATAQATTGLIVGQITDKTGAVISGAMITAKDEDKGVTFTARSDEQGNYVILNVTPGRYTVTAMRPSFGNSFVSHAVLAIDQKLLLNFKLNAGDVAQSIEVTDKPTLLQTQSAEVGTVIAGDDISNLPLLSRNFYDLTNLVPGVTQAGGSINSYALSVGGQREYGNSILLDGVESTQNRTQDVTVRPSVDSVQEFKVSTSSFDAEYGNAAGGIVQIQTKAGTNHFHGVGYEFYRPDTVAARQYSFGGPSKPSVLKQHIYGATLGGPINRDRSFFFASFEGNRQKNAYTYLDSTIPFNLINVRPNGDVDLSGLVDPNDGLDSSKCNGKKCPAPGTIDPIFDPAVQYGCYGWCKAQQFPNNVIPAARVSKAGMNTLFNFYPKPNVTGTRNGWFSNYAVNSPVTHNFNQVDSRFDQVITQRDRLYAIYHWGAGNDLVTDPYWGNTPVQGGGDADQANKQDSGAQSISITEDHTFGQSQALLNEFRFGYNRYYLDQYSLLNGTDYSTKFGVGNITVPGFDATVGFPYMFLADGYLSGGSSYKPYHVLDANLQFNDSFTITKLTGHTIKLGADYRIQNSHPDFSLFPTGFQYYSSFSSAETSDATYDAFNYYIPYVPNGWNAYGGSDIADLILGLPEVVDIGLQLTKPHTRAHALDFYGQDSWKVTQKLTVNYGLRYEYQAPFTEENNYMSNYDVASNRILLAGRGGNSNSLLQSRKDQFAPRFGLAYQINPKTVVRAGYGLFYTPENDGKEDFLTKNAPFNVQSSYYNTPYYGYVAYQLDSGVARSTAINLPQAGSIDPANVPNGNLLTTYAINPKMRTGYTDSYNLSLERQVGSSLAVDLAYVGSVSHDLSYQVGDINHNPADTSNKGDNLLTTKLGKIQYLTDAGMGNYNALQVKVTKRQSRNLSFLGSYTYSHSMDNGAAPFDVGQNYDAPQDPHNLRAEYATSDNDRRHNFVFSGMYYLPIGRGQRYFSQWGKVTDAILGGWQLNAIYKMMTGTPVNVIVGNDPTSAYPSQRPDLVGNPHLSRSARTLGEYFNIAAFAKPATPSTMGTAGRNILTGPGYVNLNSSLFKEVSVTEHAKLQLRVESFNTLNTPHFANPEGSLTNGQFGMITRQSGGDEGNRKMQFDAKILF